MPIFKNFEHAKDLQLFGYSSLKLNIDDSTAACYNSGLYFALSTF